MRANAYNLFLDHMLGSRSKCGKLHHLLSRNLFGVATPKNKLRHHLLFEFELLILSLIRFPKFTFYRLGADVIIIARSLCNLQGT